MALPNPTPTSPILLLGTLAVGVALGMAIDRGTSASAQATGPAASEAARRTGSVKSAQTKSSADEAVYQELTKQYDQFHQVNRTFELVSKAVTPSVVHIVAKKVGRHEDGNPTRFEETGSGVIVRDDRGRGLFVLTNNHVVEGASAGDIKISLSDGRVIHPERAWSDIKADIAVLKLSRTDLPAARLGNSDEAAVGSWVLALGSPFGLTHSVSQGIISARGRHERELEADGVENQDFLQTDAAINPGNSGGPLVNMKGEVVGINTAIASNGGGSEGVGFSVPVNLAKWIMGQLISSGKVSRGAMGVDLGNLDPDQAVRLGLERPRGAQVLEVHKSSPAALAGLIDGDVVLRFNGVEVVGLNQLINLVSMAPIGEAVNLVVWRDGKEHAKSVKVADRERILAQAPPSPDRRGPENLLRRSPRPSPGSEVSATNTSSALGLELVTLDGAAASRRLNLPESMRGVAVAKVEKSSPLAATIRPLDIIATVGGRAIRTADEVARALTHRSETTPLDLVLQRTVNGARQRLTVRIP